MMSSFCSGVARANTRAARSRGSSASRVAAVDDVVAGGDDAELGGDRRGRWPGGRR